MGNPEHENCEKEPIDESSFLDDELLSQMMEQFEETKEQRPRGSSQVNTALETPPLKPFPSSPFESPFAQINGAIAAVERSCKLGDTSREEDAETHTKAPCRNSVSNESQPNRTTSSFTHETKSTGSACKNSHEKIKSTSYQKPPSKQKRVSNFASCRKGTSPRYPSKSPKPVRTPNTATGEPGDGATKSSTKSPTPRNLFGGSEYSPSQNVLAPSGSCSSQEATQVNMSTRTKVRNPYLSNKQQRYPEPSVTIASGSTLTMSSASISQETQVTHSYNGEDFSSSLGDDQLCQLIETVECQAEVPTARVSPSQAFDCENEEQRKMASEGKPEVQQARLSTCAETKAQQGPSQGTKRPRPDDSVSPQQKRMRLEEVIEIDGPHDEGLGSHQDDTTVSKGQGSECSVGPPRKRMRCEKVIVVDRESEETMDCQEEDRMDEPQEIIVIDSEPEETMDCQEDDLMDGSPSLTQLVDADTRKEPPERRSTIDNMMRQRKNMEDYVKDKYEKEKRRSSKSVRLVDMVEYLRGTGKYPLPFIRAMHELREYGNRAHHRDAELPPLDIVKQTVVRYLKEKNEYERMQRSYY